MKEITRDEAFKIGEDLGLDLSNRLQNKQLEKKLNLVTGEEYKIAKSDKGEKKEEDKKESDTIRCIIHSNDRDNDEYEVVGSVNGEFFQAQIGVEIDFPKKFVPSLEGAQYTEMISEFDEDGNPTGKYKERIVKRYIIERV